MTREMSEPRSRHQKPRGHPRQQSGLALGLVRSLSLASLLVTALSQDAAASNAIVLGAATTTKCPTGAELIQVGTGVDILRISLLGAESESSATKRSSNLCHSASIRRNL